MSDTKAGPAIRAVGSISEVIIRITTNINAYTVITLIIGGAKKIQKKVKAVFIGYFIKLSFSADYKYYFYNEFHNCDQKNIAVNSV